MSGLRLVVDTNVLISAALQALGNPAAVLAIALTKPHQMYVSREIVIEYESVLYRPRLKLTAQRAAGLLNLIAEHAEYVRPLFHLYACKDPDDDKFLECAVACGADYLITGNKRDYPDEIGKVRVVNPSEFLALPE